MGLLPEQANDLATYMRETKGTPYAPYNPPVENNFNRAMMLVTAFPLLGILLPIAVDTSLLKILAYGMLLACPLLGVPALLLAAGSDAAHRKDDTETAVKKAKLSSMISGIGLVVGSVMTTLAIAAAFYGFLAGEVGQQLPPPLPGMAATEDSPSDAPAEGEEGGKAADGKAADGKAADGKAADGKAADGKPAAKDAEKGAKKDTKKGK